MVTGASSSQAARSIGIRRRLGRLATTEGHLNICAIDHPSDSFTTREGHELADGDVESLKAAILDRVLAVASGVIIDPIFGLPALGRLTRGADHGLIVNAERFRGPGSIPDGRRPGWEPEHMAAVGADAIKYVFEVADDEAERREQESAVSELLGSAHALGLPVIIEPLIARRDTAGEGPGREESHRIVACAAQYALLGADILKVQFPGQTGSEAARRSAVAACRELTDALERPWVLLSQGVSFEDFRMQVRIASTAGSSGFMAGRAVWGDVQMTDPWDGSEELVPRLRELADDAASGAPWWERYPLEPRRAPSPAAWWAADTQSVLTDH